MLKNFLFLATHGGDIAKMLFLLFAFSASLAYIVTNFLHRLHHRKAYGTKKIEDDLRFIREHKRLMIMTDPRTGQPVHLYPADLQELCIKCNEKTFEKLIKKIWEENGLKWRGEKHPAFYA